MNPKLNYGRYEILEEIGRGAMGVVYKAYDPRLKRPVALKVLRSDLTTSHEYIVRFHDEASAISQLSHPNIVNVFDQGEDHGTLFITMELLDGKSLQEVIDKQRLSHQDAIKIGVQVAEALDNAHKSGVIHRDIKPSNIIMLPGGQIKITDFGIAKIEDPDATRKTQYGQILGTPSYMSPEQVAGELLDGRSDLFSLGVILYEMITGKKPFGGSNLASISHAIKYDTPIAPDHLDSMVTPPLSNLIMKSLLKKPDERFRSGEEMALGLKKCLHRRKADVVRRSDHNQRRRSRIIATMMALTLAVVAAGAIYYIIDFTSPKPKVMVKIDSYPSDAQVYIDGILKGMTPMHIDLNTGKYEVRISKPNYYHWEVQVELDKEAEVPLFGELLPMDTDVSNDKE